MRKVPDQRLAAVASQLWDHAVAILLDRVPLLTPTLLPKPKPDLAFGYSQAAFDTNQRIAIGLLVNELGQSYAIPVGTLESPFLQVEFKAQAKGGSPFIAANKVANAGAIAMNGLMELSRRISAEMDFYINMPQFFSLTMDHMFASVNVYWQSHSAENRSVCFHMGALLNYVLTELDGLRAVHQIVKNTLDYGVRERLPRIREALDTYKQNVAVEQETATHR